MPGSSWAPAADCADTAGARLTARTQASVRVDRRRDIGELRADSSAAGALRTLRCDEAQPWKVGPVSAPVAREKRQPVERRVRADVEIRQRRPLAAARGPVSEKGTARKKS